MSGLLGSHRLGAVMKSGVSRQSSLTVVHARCANVKGAD